MGANDEHGAESYAVFFSGDQLRLSETFEFVNTRISMSIIIHGYTETLIGQSILDQIMTDKVFA